jgi:hypothetical protein
MRRQMFSMMLMALGVAALALGFSATPLASPAAAAPLLQPSPRPPLPPPTDVPPPTEPTAGPVPTDSPDDGGGDDDGGSDDDGDDAAPLPGRITGTVIDRRTGAPAGNIRVAVGDQVLFTDSSGNYDTYLPPGGYVVSLMLSAGQGTPAQGPQEVILASSEVLVVHLFFTSPLPLEPTAQPTAVPSATPAPTVAPPVAVLPDLPLPNTSVDALPTSLPVTAVSFSLGEPWAWMLMGSCLLGLGALVQMGAFKPKSRRRARPRRERER